MYSLPSLRLVIKYQHLMLLNIYISSSCRVQQQLPANALFSSLFSFKRSFNFSKKLQVFNFTLRIVIPFCLKENAFFISKLALSKVTKIIKSLTLSKANIDHIRQTISEFPWDNRLTNFNLDQQVQFSIQTIPNTISNYIPHEHITCDGQRRKSKISSS